MNFEVLCRSTKKSHMSKTVIDILALITTYKGKNVQIKGTVSRDWDGLFVVWMERGLFRDEPLIIFIPIYCFLVFNFEFYFLQRFCTKVASLCTIGATLLQCAKGCWQPSGKFFTGGKRVLATLGQICNRVSEVIGNPLTNSPEGIDKFFK